MRKAAGWLTAGRGQMPRRHQPVSLLLAEAAVRDGDLESPECPKAVVQPTQQEPTLMRRQRSSTSRIFLQAASLLCSRRLFQAV